MLTLFLGLSSIDCYAQKAKHRRLHSKSDSTTIVISDTIALMNKEALDKLNSPVDTATLIRESELAQKNEPLVKTKFIPDSRKSVWMALVIPGGGQIYNRKYWKLPIFYGGFMGCAYALNWNNNMYKDYSQAYLDIMDDDPETKSFMDFLPPNASIAGQEERFKDIFRRRKDLYRKQRDLSIFAFIGVYLLSVIDAYVDAELSDFDISKDIGMKVSPTCIDNQRGNKMGAVGLQCSIKF